VSIRSLLVVGDGRLESACALPEAKYAALLEAANQKIQSLSVDFADDNPSPTKKHKLSDETSEVQPSVAASLNKSSQGGSYSVAEAQAAYSHLSDYHKKKGWDTSGWWARKG
jgi:ubiquitin-conjugating enzyme E2 Q